jgi:hypothetical protein
MEEAYLMPAQVLADSYAHRLMAGAGQELHLDNDVDVIADITGKSVERLNVG